MAALSDLATINRLTNEVRRIDLALKAFAEGGRIVAMTVGVIPPDIDLGPTSSFDPLVFFESAGTGASVSTVHIDYPAQMVEAIRIALHARMEAIADELKGLGFTLNL